MPPIPPGSATPTPSIRTGLRLPANVPHTSRNEPEARSIDLSSRGAAPNPFLELPKADARTLLSRDGEGLKEIVLANAGGPPSKAKRLGQAERLSRFRDRMVSRMTRAMDPPPTARERKNIRSALEAFSANDLRKMARSGVRFTRDDTLPQDITKAGQFEVPGLATPARYLAPFKVIQMRSSASASAIRHELAHAKDDLANEARSPALDAMKSPRRRLGAILKRVDKNTLFSADGRKVETRVDGKPRRMPLTKMFELYRGRSQRNENGFDNPGTKEGHSRTSVQEFYAEGYSVFHGTSDYSKGKLLTFAPELYEHLAIEAKRKGLPVPDRQAVLKAYRGG